MTGTLQDTPSANRLHIGIFGRTNSGKSSFINAFSGQKVSIVADVAGTTTDPVYKTMEVYPLGPCVWIDTAGFDDEGELGKLRIEKTRLAAQKADVALVLFTGDDMIAELEWVKRLSEQHTPVIPVLGKADLYTEKEKTERLELLKKKTGKEVCCVSSVTGEGMTELKELLMAHIPEEHGERTILGNLVSEGDLVMLVMPQNIQAPKGRLILPQVQTLRELLDRKCLTMSVTTDQMVPALAAIAQPPKLIITDSQVFSYVYEHKPAESCLTSFSVLFAAWKGDIAYYVESAEALGSLKSDSRVLIAECCSHAPLKEDIGREKIPGILRKRYGKELEVEVVSGTDFPEDLSGYDLIIQCGACMFNRKYVLYRIDRAKKQQIPMTNYGIAIAWLTGILDKIVIRNHKNKFT